MSHATNVFRRKPIALAISLAYGMSVASVLPAAAVETAAAPPLIIIDNDALEQQAVSIQYQALPTDENATKVKVGAQFPIVVSSEISSKTAKLGDPVEGRLKYDLKIGERLVAERGSVVRGHVDYALRARTPIRCTLSTHRWTMTSGCIGLQFDEIINEKAEHIPLLAEPAREALVVKNKGDGRVLGINHKGEIAAPYSMQVKYMAIRLGLNAALTPAGVFSFGAVPAALGVIGAVNPSFAFGRPVGLNVRHRRLKGFCLGALSGVPGSFLLEGGMIKGEEVVIKPGDEFLAELCQEFTGKPATEAELLAGATTKVHGELVKKKGRRSEPSS
jgi:hypothetical protein